MSTKAKVVEETKRRPGRPRKPWVIRRQKREVFEPNQPVYVTLLINKELHEMGATKLKDATERTFERWLDAKDFRIKYYAIDPKMIHAIVETTDHQHLSKVMKAIAIAISRRINGAFARDGMGWFGRIFPHRYSSRVLRSTSELSEAIALIEG